MKNIFTFITFLILIFSSITKVYSIEADIFVQSTVNRAAQALNGNFSLKQKISKLKAIADDTVDINGIGMYTLGSYRKTLSNEQKNQYKTLFREYFLKSFSSRLAEYSNPEIQVESKKILNKNYTIVSSVLIATEQRPEVKIDWRVYTKNPNSLLIRDLVIEGLSLVRTQKEEFASIIQSNDGDINALFAALKKFTK